MIRTRSLIFAFILVSAAGFSSAAQTPSLSAIETPYPTLQNQVKLAGQTYAAGTCSYGPVNTPVRVFGSNLGSSGTVQFIPYTNGEAGTPVAASTTMWSSSIIFLYVPSGVSTGLIKVTTGGQTSNGLPFLVTPGSYAASCPANPSSQFTIISTSLPNATVGEAYGATLQANGGVSPYSWSLVSGALPSGLSLSSSGDITGIADTATSGALQITVQATDSSSTPQTATQQLSITVNGLRPATGSSLYTYSATGIDNVGNVTGYSDSIMGNWTFSYDTLNRLSLGSASSGPYANYSVCWSYDSFGNRTDEQIVDSGSFTNAAGAPCIASSAQNIWFDMHEYYTVDGTSSTADNGKNQATGTSAGNYHYDGAGNVTSGSGNQYLYDAEGRICAVSGASPIAYLYDAEGNRIAKGTISSFSCDPSVNGFQLTESYAIGQGGEEMSMFNGSGTWQRSNIYGAGMLLATYDAAGGLHFHVTDPLGTRRMQVNGNLTNAAGTPTAGTPELDCQSLPYGNMQNCFPDPNAVTVAADATPLHFTGQERDTESGNDYFGARYYGSSMGRWMSPDPGWMLAADLGNPQSWNQYAYALNNPLIYIDPNGLDACATDNGDGTATVVNGPQNGGVDCPGDGFYIETSQEVTAVGFNNSGDLAVYGADGNLYGSDGSAYNASQTISVSADGGSSYVPPPTILGNTAFISTQNGPTGYVSQYADYKDVFCAGDALRQNGVSLALDAASIGVGSIPGGATTLGAIKAAATLGVGTAQTAYSTATSPNVGVAAANFVTGSAGTFAGTVGVLDNALNGAQAVKAIPGIANALSLLGTAIDIAKIGLAYQACMAH